MKNFLLILITASLTIGISVFAQYSPIYWYPNSDDRLQPASDDWGIYTVNDIDFDGEILPDGEPCDPADILQKTGADNWDCVAMPAGVTEEGVQDYAWNVLGGTQTLITVTYQDGTNDVDFVVNDDLSLFSNATSSFLTSVAYGDLTGNPSDVITAGTNISWNTDTLNVDDVFIKLAGDITGNLTSDLNIDSNTFVISYDDNKVGIGTATPGTSLVVNRAGVATLEGGSATDSTLLLKKNTSSVGVGPALEFGFGADNNNYLGARIVTNIASGGGADLYFQMGSASNGTYDTKMIILKGGNVGIGVTDPDTQLEILNAGNQLKLSFDGTDNTIFAVDTSGDLTITPSGTQIIVPTLNTGQGANELYDLPLASGADADSTATSTDSGMEIVDTGLTLLRGCSDDQILKWDETNDNWNCGAAGAGATTELDNLGTVAINTSLISDTDSTDDLGSSDKYWANAYVDKTYFASNVSLNGTQQVNSIAVDAIYFKFNNAIGEYSTRLELTGSTGSTYIYTKAAKLWIGPASSYDIGTVYMSMDSSRILALKDLKPYPDSSIDLGSSTYYWAETYTDKLFLNSTATLDGATAGLVNITGEVKVSGVSGSGKIVCVKADGNFGVCSDDPSSADGTCTCG